MSLIGVVEPTHQWLMASVVDGNGAAVAEINMIAMAGCAIVATCTWAMATAAGFTRQRQEVHLAVVRVWGMCALEQRCG